MDLTGVVETGLFAVELYALMGLAFAIPFAFFLVGRLDPAAAKGSIGFRLLIIPGSALFWPLFLSRLVRRKKIPEECNAHRVCATASQQVDAHD